MANSIVWVKCKHLIDTTYACDCVNDPEGDQRFSCLRSFRLDNLWNCNRFIVDWSTYLINREHLINIGE